MDIYNLYDGDLSLFGGDLLVGLPPATVEYDFGQDGLKTGPALQGQDGLGLEQSDMGLSDPFTGISWLDTKVDLLDFIEGDVSSDFKEMPTAPDLASPDLETTTEPSIGATLPSIVATLPTYYNTNAIQVLQILADETVNMLESGETEPVVEFTSGIDILEMLASGMGANLEDMDVTPMDDYSSILSPVTPEDVDSILSSGPPSPSVEDLSLLSSNDSSFMDTSYNSSDNELITVDLAQLLSQVQSQQQQLLDSSLEELEDPTYVSSLDSNSTPKSRSKPYERKVKKDTATCKPSKEAKQLERKLRKKQQNKDAATRYRQKKKIETDVVHDECDILESRNTELKGKVDQMTREISYLKNLLAEVYEAKGLLK